MIEANMKENEISFSIFSIVPYMFFLVHAYIKQIELHTICTWA